MLVSIEKVEMLNVYAVDLLSLDAPIGEAELETLGDVICLDPEDTVEKEVIDANLKEAVQEAMGVLNERERKVIELRFGILDDRARTLEEVSREFGVTRERIRQIEGRAIKRLRSPSVSAYCVSQRTFLRSKTTA